MMLTSQYSQLIKRKTRKQSVNRSLCSSFDLTVSCIGREWMKAMRKKDFGANMKTVQKKHLSIVKNVRFIYVSYVAEIVSKHFIN